MLPRQRHNLIKKLIAVISAAVIGLHLAFRNNFSLMSRLSEEIVAPIRALQTRLSSYLPFSLAELLMALCLLWLLLSIKKGGFKRIVSGIAVFALFVYAGFCFLWGTYYYGDAGMTAEPVSVEQLASVTEAFARLATASYRPEPDRDEIIKRSGDLNGGIGVKKIVCSRVMSYLDFSGFYFPFTGEANVNVDMPAHDLASTCAHELAHLNGTAREQEANFEAVKNSLEFGDGDYVYSSALMAYTYLGNALYGADRDLWEQAYALLSPEVIEDLQETKAYWSQFETPVKEASNTVYENFLYSYGQSDGLKSYGRCVDLLVNYYYGKNLLEISGY